jgi:hypothetical protein
MKRKARHDLILLRNKILSEAHRRIEAITDTLYRVNCRRKDTTSGKIYALMALIRLRHSINAASLLIKRGHQIETLPIFRLIFEQVAWAYSIHTLNDGSLFDILPTKCINKFKEIIEGSDYMYGKLSEMAHLKPNFVFEYLKIGEPDPTIDVIIPDKAKSVSFAVNLLFSVALIGMVGEFIDKKYARKFRYLHLTNSEIGINREIARRIVNCEAKIDKLNAVAFSKSKH